MDFEDFNSIGLLFISSLVLVRHGDERNFTIAGVELLDCRFAGNYDTLMETSEQEWPFEDEDYS